MDAITIHQGTFTAHLQELHYHLPEDAGDAPATAITAEADQPLANGPAEIRYQGKTLFVLVEVYLSDPDDADHTAAEAADPDDEDLAEYPCRCDLGLRPAKGKLIQLAFNLGLLEGLSREHQQTLLATAE